MDGDGKVKGGEQVIEERTVRESGREQKQQEKKEGKRAKRVTEGESGEWLDSKGQNGTVCWWVA